MKNIFFVALDVNIYFDFYFYFYLFNFTIAGPATQRCRLLSRHWKPKPLLPATAAWASLWNAEALLPRRRDKLPCGYRCTVWGGGVSDVAAALCVHCSERDDLGSTTRAGWGTDP